MAGMSVLRGFAPLVRVVSFAGTFSGKLTRLSVTGNGCVRQMGSHKRTIDMLPSTFEWRKFKDHAHFYVLLGVIPIAVLIGATNLFIGPAELADIPENYEPKPWEYYRHPISRFIARYILDPPEKLYERHLHFVGREVEKIQLRKLEDKVKHLLDAPTHRYDYKRWYYMPAYEKASIAGSDAVEVHEETSSFK